MSGIQVEERGLPKSIHYVGETKLSQRDLHEILRCCQGDRFHRDTYNPFDHNCHCFSNFLSKLLTGKRIPDVYASFAQRIGKLIRRYYPGGPPFFLRWFNSSSPSTRYLLLE